MTTTRWGLQVIYWFVANMLFVGRAAIGVVNDFAQGAVSVWWRHTKGTAAIADIAQTTDSMPQNHGGGCRDGCRQDNGIVGANRTVVHWLAKHSAL